MNISNLMLNNDLQRKATVGLCVLFTILICFTFINMLSMWYKDWVLAHNEIVATEVSFTKPDNALPQEHLFGQSLSSDIPITSLQLRVTGIVKIDNDMTSSKAYISMSQQPSKIYHIGDSLVGGVKIYDISTDAIILENDGHFEKLPLPREKLTFKPRNIEEPY